VVIVSAYLVLLALGLAVRAGKRWAMAAAVLYAVAALGVLTLALERPSALAACLGAAGYLVLLWLLRPEEASEIARTALAALAGAVLPKVAIAFTGLMGVEDLVLLCSAGAVFAIATDRAVDGRARLFGFMAVGAGVASASGPLLIVFAILVAIAPLAAYCAGHVIVANRKTVHA
jgi:hypothetical protein